MKNVLISITILLILASCTSPPKKYEQLNSKICFGINQSMVDSYQGNIVMRSFDLFYIIGLFSFGWYPLILPWGVSLVIGEISFESSIRSDYQLWEKFKCEKL